MLDSHGFDDISSTDMVKQLDKHPLLKARVKAMLNVVETAVGDVVKAGEAEQRFIAELVGSGNHTGTTCLKPQPDFKSLF